MNAATDVRINFPEIYTQIMLGEMWSPGEVTLSGHERPENWDIQEAKGEEGASTKYNGKGVAQFQASFYLADDGQAGEGEDDFSRWEVFRRLIESTTAGPEPVALPIYHPDLAANGITEVVNGGIGGPIRDPRGGVTIQVKFLEYRPPKPKPVARARGGAGGGSGSQWEYQGEAYSPPDPNAAAKRELDGLLEEARSP